MPRRETAPPREQLGEAFARDLWASWRKHGAAALEAVRTDNAGGRRLKGLAARRAAEVALWNEDAEPDEAPSSFTRAEATPPTPVARKPLFQSKRFISAAGAGVLGAPKLISEATDRVGPFAGKSPYVQHLIEWLATAGALAAVAAAVLVWWAHSQESQK